MRFFKKKTSIRLSKNRREYSVEPLSIRQNDFQRNRTIVGTTSNNLNGVNIVRSGLESPRVHVHHLAIRRRRIFGILMVVLLSIVALWLLISNYTASPVAVISGQSITKPVKLERYNRVIQDYLEVNPMGRLSFILDQKALATYVSNELPEVASVSLLGMKQIGKTNFKITMRRPVAGWEINGKKYYVDALGVSFEQNYYDEPSVQIVDNTGAPIEAGTTSVSKRLLGFVGRVVSQALASGYVVTKAILPADTMRQLDINIQDVNPFVKLSIDRPVGEQIEDMDRAIKYFQTNQMSPTYIDVRVSNKAYYI